MSSTLAPPKPTTALRSPSPPKPRSSTPANGSRTTSPPKSTAVRNSVKPRMVAGGAATKLKKKRRTKKDEERKAAEERRKQEELERERQERIVMAEEDARSRMIEEHEKYLLRERHRREIEDSEMEALLCQHYQAINEWEVARRAEAEWKKFLECATLPDVSHEAELNTFMSLWEDKEIIARPGTLIADVVVDVLNDCQRAQLVFCELEIFLTEILEHFRLQMVLSNGAASQPRSRPSSAAQHPIPVYTARRSALEQRVLDQMRQLREISDHKLDKLTAFILQHADEFASEQRSGQQELFVNFRSGDFRLGIWANLQKNPGRIGASLEFSDVGITVDLPKSMAIISAALRVMHVPYDNFSHRQDRQQGNNFYLSVGGVWHYELLAMPPAAKKVKGWTLRQITSLANNISRIPYGSSSADRTVAYDTLSGSSTAVPTAYGPTAAAASAVPLHVALTVDKNIYIRDEQPTVGWWDFDRCCWQVRGISDVTWDNTTRMLRFTTSHMAPLSILQHRFRDLPFQNWYIKPVSTRCCVMSILCASLTEVQLEIGEGYARLLKPASEVFHELRSQKIAPALLIRQLTSRGVLVDPNPYHETLEWFTNLREKSAELERKVHRDLSYLAGAVSLKNSRWNQDPAGAPTDRMVFLVKEYRPRLTELAALPVSEDGTAASVPPPSADDQWHTCIVSTTTSIISNLRETSTAFTEELAERAKDHRHLYHSVADVVSDAARERLRETSPQLAQSVECVFNLLRLFTFTV